MSLFRQLWLAVISLTIVIFIGSFLVSVLNARSYLEQQLSIKNIDNANALALTLSQLPERDPTAIELLISAQFDSGHYQEIRLDDPAQRVILQRTYAGDALARRFGLRRFSRSALRRGWRKYKTVGANSVRSRSLATAVTLIASCGAARCNCWPGCWRPDCWRASSAHYSCASLCAR